MKKLISEYRHRKKQIKRRLQDFEILRESKNKDIFAELCFCLLTPQSKAVNCDKAIKELKKDNLLFEGSLKSIRHKLKGRARFHNKKSTYLIGARKIFTNKRRIDIKDKLNTNDIAETRVWLVKNVKGLGYKEASHFLRNIGLGEDLSILDGHILKNLKKFGVIKKIPSSLAGKRYIDIENKMRKFAERMKIPLAELDLLLWSNETGFVFK